MLSFAEYVLESDEKEYDYRGHTGPRTFHYIRRTDQQAGKNFHFGSTYGQDIEPHGRYMTERPSTFKPSHGTEEGTVHFKNPLVLPWGDKEGGYSHPSNWKQVLHRQFKRKGRALSKAILKKGHDGIITHDANGHSSEVVDLTNFR